ncbi:MAG: thiamine-phosphate kinase [Gemmatimonadetes bacterium]|nr:thiamine-phosphate kinase [Gemmatimonadota bacterium]
MRLSSAFGPGAEFDFLRRVLEGAPAVESPWIAVGPGDDAAILAGDSEAYWVLTSDLQVEGVHFRLDWIREFEAGGRAVRAALSDLAAVAAEPVGVLVSASFPSTMSVERAESALAGAADAAAECGAGVLGGDVSRGGRDVALDVVAIGRSRSPVLRSGARPGDVLWVTGVLGAAAAAVGAWCRGTEPSAEARERFVRPVPRLREALWLAERGIPSAMIDLSDGLVADAGHLAAASGVRVEIAAPAVPAAPGAGTAEALTGGEDYELLLTAPPGSLEPVVAEFESSFKIPVRSIGRVVVGAGVQVYGADGRVLPIATPGYDHFRDG